MRELDKQFNLTALADRYGSDKGSITGDPHNYTLFYEMLLAPRRESIHRMLEIGLLRNGPEVGVEADRVTGDLPSIRMWLDYFPNATVHGFDISDFSFYQDPRFRFFRGDSGKAADLERVAPDGETFDFIIDDGSHASFHQQLAFCTLFPKLKPGGLYIVEDLQWQSPIYENSLPATIRTVDLLDHWLKTRRFPALEAPELQSLATFSDEIGIVILLDHPFIQDRVTKAAVIHKAF